MNSNRASALIIVLVAVALLGVVGVTVPPPGGKGASWFAPSTWVSHKPADKVDDANKKVSQSGSEIVHAGHVEAFKVGEALNYVPDSPATTLAKRFSLNSLSLLGQVDTVTEANELRTLVLDMLSKDAARVAAAELRQREAEKSETKLAARHIQDQQALVKANGDLRGAFEERNALANELESEHARNVILISLAVILLGVACYFRANLASVGNVFHKLGVNDENSPIVKEITGELGKLGQWAIRSGRNVASDLEIKTKAQAAKLAQRMGVSIKQ